MDNLKDFLLPNEPTGILACSATDARFWRATARFGPWSLIDSMHHPAGAAREQDIAADRPGRAFDSFGKGRHAMSAAESGREHEIRRFAKDVAELVNSKIASGDLAHLVLIAPPRFLGYLRQDLSDMASRAVRVAAPKNLTHLEADEIKRYFE